MHGTRNDTQERTRMRAAALGGLAAGAGALLLASAARGVDEETPRLELARTALERWVETRRVISKEKRDWAEGRELLEARIDLVQHEIETRRGQIAEARKSIGEADGKLAELVAENERLKQASASLEGVIGALEARTRELLARLPDPIRERVKPLSQSLPADPADTKLSLSERFQSVVGILNEVNKFDREMTTTSEVRTLADGTTAEVTAVYVGIGQGYYVTASGDAAGVGTAGPGGWTWTPDDAAAPQIAEAVAILKGEQPAHFVRLPVKVE
jgi:Protein of unknown function (DUF3450)